MNQLAPPGLAQEWDNVGLQIGDPRLPVRRIWVALDPSLKVVKAACEKKIDLLITHHPLIFRPLKSIDFDTPGGSIIQMASQHQLSIFSAHSNLDIVRDGVNDVLAKRLELKHLEILQPVKIEERFKDDIFLLDSGELEHGIGRIGSLAKTSNLKSLALIVKEKLKLNFVKVTGNPEQKVTQVAICSGSGSSLMQTFIASAATSTIMMPAMLKARIAELSISDIFHQSTSWLRHLHISWKKYLPEKILRPKSRPAPWKRIHFLFCNLNKAQELPYGMSS
jgi:dinuclear metal center YbgI/SA1388 family protein